MRKGLLILLALICIPTLAWPDATGMRAKFAIFVVDNEMAPLTGKWVYAAEWGTRAPVKVGGSAIEEGNGQYYFKIGTCDSCVPAGTYDIWVDNSLDSTYAGLFVGYGDEPTANSISSTHVIDGSLQLNADFDGTYGTDATQLGTVFDVAGQTKIQSTEDDDMVTLSLTNYGSGRNKTTRQSVLQVSHTANDLNDSTASSGGILIDLDTHPTLDLPARMIGAPFGIKYTARHHYKGTALMFGIYNSDWYDNFGRHSDFAGIYGYMAIDSCTKWWAPGLPDAGTPIMFEGRMAGRRVGDMRGVYIDAEADSSVGQAFGFATQIDGTTSSSFGKKTYGFYSYVRGAQEVYGHKSYAVGKGAGCDVYGSYVAASQDTVFGMGGTVHGIYAHALHRVAGQNQGYKRCWGIEALAGGDSAYGGQFFAYSDVDQNDNFARGVEGYAEGGYKNIGVLGHAEESDGTTNIGVFGHARDNGYSYGGLFRATSPTADRNYGIWARGDSGVIESWAGRFEGQVAADTLKIPHDAEQIDADYPARIVIEAKANAEGGISIDLASGSTTDNIGIWVAMDGASSGDYGLYTSNGAYGVFQSGTATENYFDGDVEVNGILSASPIQYGTGAAGLATIPTGSDSVVINTIPTSALLAGRSKANTTILVAAVGRIPDAGWNKGGLCVDNIGELRGANYVFVIRADTTQAADQEAFWQISLR